jgi:hypothetical protein
MTPENDQNPTQPLPNPEHEAFAQFAVAGLTVTEAYQKARPGRTARITARGQGSRWQARPEIAARIRELHLQRANAPKTTEPPPKAQQTPASVAPPAPDESPITRQELRQLISSAIKQGNPDPALVSALLKVDPALGEAGTDKPHPTDVVAYLVSFAGRSGKDLVQDLGGLELVLDMVRTACDVSWADLHACTAARTSEGPAIH